MGHFPRSRCASPLLYSAQNCVCFFMPQPMQNKQFIHYLHQYMLTCSPMRKQFAQSKNFMNSKRGVIYHHTVNKVVKIIQQKLQKMTRVSICELKQLKQSLPTARCLKDKCYMNFQGNCKRTSLASIQKQNIFKQEMEGICFYSRIL